MYGFLQLHLLLQLLPQLLLCVQGALAGRVQFIQPRPAAKSHDSHMIPIVVPGLDIGGQLCSLVVLEILQGK